MNGTFPHRAVVGVVQGGCQSCGAGPRRPRAPVVCRIKIRHAAGPPLSWQCWPRNPVSARGKLLWTNILRLEFHSSTHHIQSQRILTSNALSMMHSSHDEQQIQVQLLHMGAQSFRSSQVSCLPLKGVYQACMQFNPYPLLVQTRFSEEMDLVWLQSPVSLSQQQLRRYYTLIIIFMRVRCVRDWQMDKCTPCCQPDRVARAASP